MYNYFIKLPLKIDVSHVINAPRTLIQVADVHNRTRYKYTEWRKETAPPTPLLMYTLPQDVVGSVLAQLPQQLLQREVPGIFFMRMPKPCADSKSLPPHVDRGRRTAINIYLQCAGEITEFYSVDEKNKKLTCVGSFTAAPGDAWLLDVSKPHAVIMCEAQERTGLTLSFRHVRYHELAEILGVV